MLSYVTRQGKLIPADEAFHAWNSGDLKRMIAALDAPTNPVDRHFLLMRVCQQAYRLRDSDPAMRTLARRVGLQHVQEFEDLRRPLVRDLGVLPQVPTFQNLCTLLAEDGEYQMAIDVCKKAIGFRLSDGTKGGFRARIARLQRQAAKAKNAK
jgi:hypothetical protein